MANPNPSPKTRYTTNRNEPLTSSLSMKISASMKQRLKEQENWQELVREAIAKALEEKESQEDDLQSV